MTSHDQIKLMSSQTPEDHDSYSQEDVKDSGEVITGGANSDLLQMERDNLAKEGEIRRGTSPELADEGDDSYESEAAEYPIRHQPSRDRISKVSSGKYQSEMDEVVYPRRPPSADELSSLSSMDSLSSAEPPPAPHTETDAIKEEAGNRLIEEPTDKELGHSHTAQDVSDPSHEAVEAPQHSKSKELLGEDDGTQQTHINDDLHEMHSSKAAHPILSPQDQFHEHANSMQDSDPFSNGEDREGFTGEVWGGPPSRGNVRSMIHSFRPLVPAKVDDIDGEQHLGPPSPDVSANTTSQHEPDQFQADDTVSHRNPDAQATSKHETADYPQAPSGAGIQDGHGEPIFDNAVPRSSLAESKADTHSSSEEFDSEDPNSIVNLHEKTRDVLRRNHDAESPPVQADDLEAAADPADGEDVVHDTFSPKDGAPEHVEVAATPSADSHSRPPADEATGAPPQVSQPATDVATVEYETTKDAAPHPDLGLDTIEQDILESRGDLHAHSLVEDVPDVQPHEEVIASSAQSEDVHHSFGASDPSESAPIPPSVHTPDDLHNPQGQLKISEPELYVEETGPPTEAKPLAEVLASHDETAQPGNHENSLESESALLMTGEDKINGDIADEQSSLEEHKAITRSSSPPDVSGIGGPSVKSEPSEVEESHPQATDVSPTRESTLGANQEELQGHHEDFAGGVAKGDDAASNEDNEGIDHRLSTSDSNLGAPSRLEAELPIQHHVLEEDREAGIIPTTKVSLGPEDEGSQKNDDDQLTNGENDTNQAHDLHFDHQPPHDDSSFARYNELQEEPHAAQQLPRDGVNSSHLMDATPAIEATFDAEDNMQARNDRHPERVASQQSDLGQADAAIGQESDSSNRSQAEPNRLEEELPVQQQPPETEDDHPHPEDTAPAIVTGHSAEEDLHEHSDDKAIDAGSDNSGPLDWSGLVDELPVQHDFQRDGDHLQMLDSASGTGAAPAAEQRVQEHEESLDESTHRNDMTADEMRFASTGHGGLPDNSGTSELSKPDLESHIQHQRLEAKVDDDPSHQDDATSATGAILDMGESQEHHGSPKEALTLGEKTGEENYIVAVGDGSHSVDPDAGNGLQEKSLVDDHIPHVDDDNSIPMGDALAKGAILESKEAPQKQDDALSMSITPDEGTIHENHVVPIGRDHTPDESSFTDGSAGEHTAQHSLPGSQTEQSNQATAFRSAKSASEEGLETRDDALAHLEASTDTTQNNASDQKPSAGSPIFEKRLEAEPHAQRHFTDEDTDDYSQTPLVTSTSKEAVVERIGDRAEAKAPSEAENLVSGDQAIQVVPFSPKEAIADTVLQHELQHVDRNEAASNLIDHQGDNSEPSGQVGLPATNNEASGMKMMNQNVSGILPEEKVHASTESPIDEGKDLGGVVVFSESSDSPSLEPVEEIPQSEAHPSLGTPEYDTTATVPAPKLNSPSELEGDHVFNEEHGVSHEDVSEGHIVDSTGVPLIGHDHQLPTMETQGTDNQSGETEHLSSDNLAGALPDTTEPLHRSPVPQGGQLPSVLESLVDHSSEPLSFPNLQQHDALAIRPEDDMFENAASNIPEAPLTPQSSLGIHSPTFDSRSVVSAASRVPTPPTTPRSDPLASIEPLVLQTRLIDTSRKPGSLDEPSADLSDSQLLVPPDASSTEDVTPIQRTASQSLAPEEDIEELLITPVSHVSSEPFQNESLPTNMEPPTSNQPPEEPQGKMASELHHESDSSPVMEDNVMIDDRSSHSSTGLDVEARSLAPQTATSTDSQIHSSEDVGDSNPAAPAGSTVDIMGEQVQHRTDVSAKTSDVLRSKEVLQDEGQQTSARSEADENQSRETASVEEKATAPSEIAPADPGQEVDFEGHEGVHDEPNVPVLVLPIPTSDIEFSSGIKSTASSGMTADQGSGHEVEASSTVASTASAEPIVSPSQQTEGLEDISTEPTKLTNSDPVHLLGISQVAEVTSVQHLNGFAPSYAPATPTEEGPITGPDHPADLDDTLSPPPTSEPLAPRGSSPVQDLSPLQHPNDDSTAATSAEHAPGANSQPLETPEHQTREVENASSMSTTSDLVSPKGLPPIAGVSPVQENEGHSTNSPLVAPSEGPAGEQGTGIAKPASNGPVEPRSISPVGAATPNAHSEGVATAATTAALTQRTIDAPAVPADHPDGTAAFTVPPTVESLHTPVATGAAERHAGEFEDAATIPNPAPPAIIPPEVTVTADHQAQELEDASAAFPATSSPPADHGATQSTQLSESSDARDDIESTLEFPKMAAPDRSPRIVLSAIQEDGASDEARSWVDSSPSPIMPSPGLRTRQLSNTSKVLPGGWAYSLQSESRPSLDMASGEFVPAVREPPKEKSNKCIIM